MTVRVVTDSAAALAPETAAEHDVRVVPITLTLGDEEYADGELSDAEFEARAGGPVPTSAPSPGAWLDAMQAEPGPVVVVTVSDQLSSSHKSAVVASGMYDGEAVVVDSGTAAGAQAIVVLAAVRAAAAGGPLDEVAGTAQTAAGQVRLIGTLASLDRLVKGGRVPGLAGLAGRMLGVNPLFELSQGKVRPMRPAFSRDAALERVIAAFRDSHLPGTVAEVVASHALCPDDAERLLAAVRAETQPALALVGGFGAALLAHAGPGTVGLSWRWAPVG